MNLKFAMSVKGRAQDLQSSLSWTIHLRGLAHLNTSLSETKSTTFIILKYSQIPFSLGNREISQVNKSNLHWKKIHPQLKLERPTDNPKVDHIKVKTPNKSQKEKGQEILPREGQFRSIKKPYLIAIARLASESEMSFFGGILSRWLEESTEKRQWGGRRGTKKEGKIVGLKGRRWRDTSGHGNSLVYLWREWQWGFQWSDR